MKYNDVARIILKLPNEQYFAEELRVPLIVPEIDDEIEEFLSERIKIGKSESVFQYSSNDQYSIIWVHKLGITLRDYVKEDLQLHS